MHLVAQRPSTLLADLEAFAGSSADETELLLKAYSRSRNAGLISLSRRKRYVKQRHRDAELTLVVIKRA